MFCVARDLETSAWPWYRAWAATSPAWLTRIRAADSRRSASESATTTGVGVEPAAATSTGGGMRPEAVVPPGAPDWPAATPPGAAVWPVPPTPAGAAGLWALPVDAAL